MQIGSPSVESVLVVAATFAAVLGVSAVVLTRDVDAARSPASDVAQPWAPLPVLVVVAGDSPSDVAVGRPVAEALGGALLAVDATGLTEGMTAELSRSSPDQVLILGGPDAVPEATASALWRYTLGSVTRLAGADRFATAALVAQSQFTSPVRQVRILSGEVPASPSSAVGQEDAGTPVLLVEARRIPPSAAAALRALRPGSIGVVGGPDAVSDGVLEQLQAYTTGRVLRLS